MKDKPKIMKFITITLLGVLFLVLLYVDTKDLMPSPEDSLNETNITQPTFQQIYVYCNTNLQNYTLSNPDYLVCQTQDECDLKSLRLNVLQGEAFNCMDSFWKFRE